MVTLDLAILSLIWNAILIPIFELAIYYPPFI